MLGGLLLAVPDWARLSIIRASVLPVVRHSRRTVLMPDLQQCGRRDGKEGPLAPRTRRHIHRISNSALARAVEQQVLARNPADVFRKRLPKVERKPMAVFTAEQSAEFLSAIKHTHTYWPVQENAATRLDLAFGPAIRRVSLASKKVQYQFQ